MKDLEMNDTDLRLVQVFLSQSISPSPAIFEVSTRRDNSFHCTCPGYRGKDNCKHIKFVKARIDANFGAYPLEISSKASQEEVEQSAESNEAFRKFILRYGKIEVF